MAWHWKPAIVSCATTVFVSVTQRTSSPRCVTIFPMEPLRYPLLVTANNTELLTADVNINYGFRFRPDAGRNVRLFDM